MPWFGAKIQPVVLEISLKTGNMNTQKYNQIFIHRAIPSGKCRIKKGFIDSMHDSNPNYTTSAVKVFMNRTTCSGALAFIGWLSPKFLHQFAIFMAKYKEGGSRLEIRQHGWHLHRARAMWHMGHLLNPVSYTSVSLSTCTELCWFSSLTLNSLNTINIVALFQFYWPKRLNRHIHWGLLVLHYCAELFPLHIVLLSICISFPTV